VLQPLKTVIKYRSSRDLQPRLIDKMFRILMRACPKLCNLVITKCFIIHSFKPNEYKPMKNIPFQLDLRPALPFVYGAKDDRDLRETFLAMGRILLESGLENRFERLLRQLPWKPPRDARRGREVRQEQGGDTQGNDCLSLCASVWI